MASLQTFAAAALVAVTGGGLARAVDLPPAPALPPAETSSNAFSGWYLRGDLGAGIETAPKLDAASGAIAAGIPLPRLSPFAVSSFPNTTLSPSGTIDGGVGYVFNPWLRMDATLEYRFGGELRSTAAIDDPAPPGAGRSAPPTASAEASRRSSRWSTAMSISAITGARRPSSAPESASPTMRSPASPTRASQSPGRARSFPSAGSSPTPRGRVSPGR